MGKRTGYRFDIQTFAKMVREKRGSRTLREIAQELDMSIATLSRIENAKFPPDPDNYGIICYWLKVNPGIFYVLDQQSDNDDPIMIQLRATQKMSAETANAFMDLFRAAYEKVLEQANEEDKA